MTLTPGNSIHLFTIFGTPVYMQLNYLLLVAMPFISGDGSPKMAMVWAIVVFVSLLVHEFGHVAANATNGQRSAVVLWMLGGLTFNERLERMRGWRGIWASVAGPLAGFVVWAIFWFLLMPKGGLPGLRTSFSAMLDPQIALIGIASDELRTWHLFWVWMCWVNLVWGLFNLLPIFPLDGGQALEEILRFRLRAIEATRWSSIISIATIVGFVWWQTSRPGGHTSTMMIVVLAMLGFQNWQRLRGRE